VLRAATWGTILFHPKLITDLRRGVERRRNSREVQRSTFARFLGLFDFRLLQQYLPTAEVGSSIEERMTQHDGSDRNLPLRQIKRTQCPLRTRVLIGSSRA